MLQAQHSGRRTAPERGPVAAAGTRLPTCTARALVGHRRAAARLAVLNLLLLLPELGLRAAGFRYESGIEFGYPRPSHFVALEPHDRELRAIFLEDGIHFTTEGHRRVAREVAAMLGEGP